MNGVGALTIYRLGGADLPAPELEGIDFDFVQLSWDDLDESRLGASEGVEMQPGFIRPERLDPNTNLAPLVLAQDAFTVYSRGNWNVPSAISLVTRERFSFWMVDADSATIYEDTRGLNYMFDLGKQVYLHRVHFFTRDHSNAVVPRFIVGTNDGDRRLDGFRDYMPSNQTLFDFDILHEGRGNRVIDLRIPPTPVRRLHFGVEPKQLIGEETEGIHARGATPFLRWEVAEFELYASGHVAFARYASSVIDLGEQVNLGPLIWSGRQEADTQVELRMRSGSDEDPNVYWRQTFRGNEQVPYTSSGDPLSRRDYERLELAELGDITHDLDHWSAWSAAYDFAANQGRSNADQPRRFVQFDVSFHSTPEAGGQLDYLQFAASPPLVTHARAEITPAQAAADAMTAFTYKLRPQLEIGDKGFDRIAIDTPALVDTAVGVESVRLGGVEVEFTTPRLDEHGFTVEIPRIGLAHTEELIEISFRSQIFAYDTPFIGRLLDNEVPFEVPQTILAGDADETVDSNTLRVALAHIPKHPIQTMRLSPRAFSPNGDGVNDVVRIDYELLNLSGGTPTRIGVYDLSGRQVSTVFSALRESGLFHAAWDGTNAQGTLVTPGLYLLQLEVEADRSQDRIQRLVSVVY
jgi:hypothetical protein